MNVNARRNLKKGRCSVLELSLDIVSSIAAIILDYNTIISISQPGNGPK